MTYFTDQELDAATEAMLQNILAPYQLQGLPYVFIHDALKNFVRRQAANALTAAAKARGVV